MTETGINRGDLLVLASAGKVGATLAPVAAAGTEAGAAKVAGRTSAEGNRILARRPNIILFVPDEMRGHALALKAKVNNLLSAEGINPKREALSKNTRRWIKYSLCPKLRPGLLKKASTKQ
ncbi:MAG TPA: hypothetical protein VFA39_17280 [Steroidobacteraceae bacterium]|nr:hypothetical protein [Steroidobacteraceae bacterium]